MTYSQLSISLGRPSDTVLWVLWRCAGREDAVNRGPLFGARAEVLTKKVCWRNRA